MNEVRIFTTPILDGIKITEYKGIVISRNVRAVNVIRDFFTSFRDIFGGRSVSYQDVMKAMQDDVIAEAKEEASRLGANAIVGFSLDYDNVGSKNKSLLMASAKGTAVVIE
ncbi:MAG: YbjQ family protein [Planctomycetes bacterium]|nr:YbjQ family protein [Planctomycetota bacterium]